MQFIKCFQTSVGIKTKNIIDWSVKSLAKDGSNRGGFRVGAGRKKKTLADKILDGQTEKPDVKQKEHKTAVDVQPEAPQYAIPNPRDFLDAEQKNMNGIGNMSRQIYDHTMRWIAERDCLDVVPQCMVERYAVAAARWEQCDRVISMFGVAAKHPTTNAQIGSPYVTMALQWLKQANQQWYLIEQKVKEYCGDRLTGKNAFDPMEAILSGRFTGLGD